MLRGESGIAGTGVKCHVCSGQLGLCGGMEDGGTVFDCGEGVTSCMLGKSSGLLC